MQILRPAFEPETFFERLRLAQTRILMLDYDGTLAPFHVDPAEARPYPAIPPLLDAILAGGRTRVVIVSGRWIRSLLPLLQLHHQPEIWGSYGWEHTRPDGAYTMVSPDTTAFVALAKVQQWTQELTALGARCERKPAALAFHWRGLTNAQIVDIRARIFERWMQLGAAGDLGWHDFDGGIEFRAHGWNKGEVVRAILSDSGPETACAYLGDDVEDERAFRALHGQGLAVLVRTQLRSTAADLWLQPPDEVCRFLERWEEVTR